MRKLRGRLRIAHKLLLSCIFFAIPIGVLLWYVVDGHNQHIRFAEKERSGAEIIAKAAPAMELIAEFAIDDYIARVGGEQDYRSAESEKRIHKALADLEHFAGKYSEIMDLSSGRLGEIGKSDILPGNIMKKWDVFLREKSDLGNEELSENYMIFLQNINSLIRYIGDKSNLILDPDLDSYYMMDISLLAMPDLTRRLAEFTINAANAAADTAGNTDIPGYIYNVAVNDLLPRIVSDAEVSVREDATFHGDHPALGEDMVNKASEFRNRIENYLAKWHSPGAQPLRSLAADSHQSFSQMREFWLVSNSTLIDLLNKRIDYYQTRKWTSLAISLAAVALAAIVVFLIALGISRRLRSVTRITSDIAMGNIAGAKEALEKCRNRGTGVRLDSPGAAKTRDESVILLQEINIMTHNLDSLLSEVRNTGIRMTSSATEISASARQLESTITEQAGSINQINSTSREIAANSGDLSDTMKLLLDQASEAARVSHSGVEALDELNETIHALIDSSEEIAEKLSFISSSATNIGEVITTITKVANQTNLLSLNAAIEAEKAGEAGVGFAVVAREIRRLADQTAVATLDIEDMVRQMDAAIREGAAAVDNNSRQRDVSQEKIGRISREFTVIIDQTREIEPRFGEVTEGMNAQSESALTISDAMARLNDAARQTREAIGEFNQVTAALRDSSQNLQKELGRFRTEQE